VSGEPLPRESAYAIGCQPLLARGPLSDVCSHQTGRRKSEHYAWALRWEGIRLWTTQAPTHLQWGTRVWERIGAGPVAEPWESYGPSVKESFTGRTRSCAPLVLAGGRIGDRTVQQPECWITSTEGTSVHGEQRMMRAVPTR